MSLTTKSALGALLPGRITSFDKQMPSSTGLSGDWASCWTDGVYPPAGAIPPTGPGEVPTKDTTGALPLVNADTGKQMYLAEMGLHAATNANYTWFMLCDRLVHTSGLSANVNTLQTVNSVSVPSGRDPDGLGAPILVLEFYGSPGVTSSGAVTVSYTNQSGVSGRSANPVHVIQTSAIIATNMIVCELQQGDTGVRSVETVQLTTATGTAGNFGITLLRPIWVLNTLSVRAARRLDWQHMGLAKVYNDSCLAFVAGGSGTAADVYGWLKLVEA